MIFLIDGHKIRKTTLRRPVLISLSFFLVANTKKARKLALRAINVRDIPQSDDSYCQKHHIAAVTQRKVSTETGLLFDTSMKAGQGTVF